MKDFVVKGKIIDKNKKVAVKVPVKAYNHHLAFLGDPKIGETVTDANGTFEIKFNESRFEEFKSIFERGLHVYLIIEYEDEDGRKTSFTTKPMRIEKELEYHIKLAEYIPDPFAVDIYANTIQRIRNIIKESGLTLNNQQINLSALTHGNLPDEIKTRFQNILDGHNDRKKMFDDLNALITGYIGVTSQEYHLDTIGYDGPQVPKNAWREGEQEVIIWPRKEEFNWE